MLKIKFLFLIATFFLFIPLSSIPNPKLLANETVAKPAQDKTTIDAKQLDKRAEILRQYLQRYNSPLEYHAQDFVDAADKYGLDWKLVASISGVESTFGKAIPGGYNAWGWGVYGDQALGFKSWKDGIFTVSKGLKEGYIDKGLVEPYAMNHVYAASPTWGTHVTYFLQDLDIFSKKQDSKTSIQTQNELIKTFTGSAQIAYKSAN